MVDSITRFIVEKIGDYLIQEASMFMGVKDELEELKGELTCIQGYLKDVEAREREDEVSKEWTQLVLDIAYDVEDVLDSYNLKVEERSQRQGLIKKLTFKLSEMMETYSIADDLKNLKRRILDVTRKRQTYGIGNELRGETTSSWSVRQLRRARSVNQEEHVVGLEDDAKILLAKLLDEGDNKRYMISIFGMGGLGKTALVRKLYNCNEVKRIFDYRAWTYVSQEYKIRYMLMRVIRSLGVVSREELERIRMFIEEDLEVYLHDLLEEKKYMIVLDDVWEVEALESLKRALPCNQKGGKVIITTRSKAVAESVDERVYAHKLRFLTFEESWNLFQQKAFRDIGQIDQDQLKTGESMVQKCGGLPLAIMVLAGLLSRKRPNEWNEVRSSFWRRLKDNSIHVSTVFDLSFKELRHELKLCFLYLSVFPEDYEIDVQKLTHLLVAEGFIQEDDEEMVMEDVARYYIEELIGRSLVETLKRERGRLISCRMHDLLRDIVIKKAKELNFVHVNNDKVAQHSMNCRREVVHHQMNSYLCNRRMNKRMRSFLFFGEQMRKEDSLGHDFDTVFSKLKLLRVLDLGGVRFVCNGGKRSLPDVIGDLIHLRYLGIVDTFVNDLPAFISSNLRFLQTLDASSNDYFRQTIDFRKLTSLRHLIGRFIGDLVIGDAVNLQTLRSISSYSWSKLNHESLVNLRELEIYDSMWIDQIRVPLELSSFSKLTNLRALTLKVPTFKLSSEEAVRFETLVELTLRCDVKKLPNDMDSIFPNLESLRLVGLTLEEDPMPALKKLQRLEDVVLDSCDYLGVKMNISEQGFHRLRKLTIYIDGLEELHIGEEAVPSLMELNMRSRGRQVNLIVPDRLRAILLQPLPASGTVE